MAPLLITLYRFTKILFQITSSVLSQEKNSFDFIEKIKNIQVLSNYKIMSLDAVDSVKDDLEKICIASLPLQLPFYFR